MFEEFVICTYTLATNGMESVNLLPTHLLSNQCIGAHTYGYIDRNTFSAVLVFKIFIHKSSTNCREH